MSGANPALQDFIPTREIPRRKLINAGIANQRFRRAVLEAAGEVASEFTNHYWKEIVQGNESLSRQPEKLPPPTSTQVLTKGFISYMNASGRYLVLREHLRQAVSHIVQQRCLNIKPSGFQTHREFQNFLHDMYNYLIDDVHETLKRSLLHETDPLDPTPNPLPKSVCDNDPDEPPQSLKELQALTLLRDLLFYSEESFAQGDFDNCQRIHLQRICRSREMPNCWVEFSLMWLSRGDERMAEIAVREALRRAPRYIYALLIGGLIAIRHDDARGIPVISAALEIKPISPEILVIMGLSHACLGQEENADYFFRKAAFIHRTLTGLTTEGLHEMFDNVSKTVNVAQSIKEMSKVESTLTSKQYSASVVEDQLIDLMSVPNNPEESIAEEIIAVPQSTRRASLQGKKRKSSELAKMASEQRLQKNTEIPEVSSRQSIINNENGSEEALEDEFYTRKNSLSRDVPPPTPIPPKYDFTPELTDIRVEDSILPVLRPSILIPWNITEFTEQLKELVEIDVTYYQEEQTQKRNSQVLSTTTVDAAPETVIVAEYDDLLKKKDSLNKKRKSSDKGQGDSPLVTKVKVKSMEGSSRKSRKNSLLASSKSKSLKGKNKHGNALLQDQNELKRTSDAMKPITSSKANYDFLEEDEGEPYIEQEEDGSLSIHVRPSKQEIAPPTPPPAPTFVKKLGSELIWTAQLLLQLRMFDMLDGVLTRELYVSGKRTIQFLYLRAMSLYMRQCQAEALPLLEEALKLDPDNPRLWIIKGHCFYEQGNTTEANTSYETALRLPVGKENRHLLYLRFGSLALDSGSLDTAKRVFMYGIQKYPTPTMWLAVGNTCYLMGDYDQAEAAFSEANRMDHTNPLTWAHLALVNLANDKQSLAEQSYKWALRFGLKKGKLLDEIKKLQQEKGFGDPGFPRIPNCIPDDYYARRASRQKPFDIYREALLHEGPTVGKNPFDNTEKEEALKEKLQNAQKEADGVTESGLVVEKKTSKEDEQPPNTESVTEPPESDFANNPSDIQAVVTDKKEPKKKADRKSRRGSSAKTRKSKKPKKSNMEQASIEPISDMSFSEVEEQGEEEEVPVDNKLNAAVADILKKRESVKQKDN